MILYSPGLPAKGANKDTAMTQPVLPVPEIRLTGGSSPYPLRQVIGHELGFFSAFVFRFDVKPSPSGLAKNV
jgi:hypothetical protein